MTTVTKGDAAPNGVYAVGSGFPTQSFRGGNYWVDVVYTPPAPGTVPNLGLIIGGLFAAFYGRLRRREKEESE